ncbi:MAG: glycine cleavage system aminomethyltransferase GcvT [Burkholderiales bacterium]|nr:Aminomethyltransferase [Rhodocyclaceae bacterium]MCQ3923200.1 glycine cleavage system aminomethyltransferase GcvT [Rhodocyclaceae bacterium]MCZ2418238.1 glycine cleavage system aminomethyltransferase GcvT [Burkholderiales bacterium]HNQ56493.1 glycine cleavage system aminomethyltransferase GcvT [Candidatus Desulfobacillus denitrificans]HNT62953.1 glycine cleavage system aminomethyltransferase GcvT [Candidatus Desulfobacillus denitrificans]
MTKQTPLYATHVRLGGKMVDFAGWDMPLHYGSQVEEHHLVRRDAGMFDVSHMLALDLEGAGAHDLLHRLIANNVDKLTVPGRALYSCMLNAQGGVIDDLIVYFFRPDFYRVVVNAGTADKDLAWIAQHAGSVQVKPRRDLAMIAVQGPNARAKTWAALPGSEAASSGLKPFHAAWFGDALIARTGYTGEDGFELMIPADRAEATWNALLAAGVKPAGLGARDTLRLEAGMPLYGQDMDEQTSPLEAGLAWTVDLDAPRDFTGKSVLAARRPDKQTLGLLLEDRGVLRAHQKIFAAQGEGEITSGSFSPSMNRSIALARLPAACAVGDTVEVEIRDKRLKATVVKPPFVRNGKVLV